MKEKKMNLMKKISQHFKSIELIFIKRKMLEENLDVKFLKRNIYEEDFFFIK